MSCDRKKSWMTPCYEDDGMVAVCNPPDNPLCVGCEKKLNLNATDLAQYRKVWDAYMKKTR